MSAIRGSWEDRLETAMDAAEINDPTADSLFGDLIGKLNRLSEKALLAGDGHLLDLRNSAISGYASWLVENRRYDDALALLDMLQDDKFAEVYARQWLTMRAQLLSLQGRNEESAETWLEIATLFSDDIRALIAAQTSTMRLGRLTIAASISRMIDVALDEHSTDPRGYQSADGAVARANLLYGMGKWDEGLAWFTRGLALDDSAGQVLGSTSEIGWLAGAPAREVIKLTETVKEPNKRALYWRALMLQELGEDTEARSLLRTIAQGKASEISGEDEVMWALAHFALGDDKRAGLAAMLAVQGDFGEATSWLVYAATGIGSALHGDMAAARLNMILAADSFRKHSWESERLPVGWHIIASRILPAARFAEIEGYFQMPRRTT